MLEIVKSLINRWRRRPLGDFVRRKRYKLALTNLSARSNVFEIRGRKWSMILWLLLAISLVVVLWTLALVYTPMKAALPARMRTDMRDRYADIAVKVDSTISVASKNVRYAQNVISILQDSMPRQTDAPKEEVTKLPLDSLVEASEAERSFVQRFESSERYNLSVLTPIAAEGMVFYAPVAGCGSDERVSDSGIPYVAIAVGKSTPISAVYRGTVINSYYTTGRGITLVIQHPNGFISQYSGLSESFVARGDKVNAGTRLGMSSDARYPLYFELWHNGSPLKPADYIDI